MTIEKMNLHYSFTNPASVYDEEALTALELAGRQGAKINEIIEAQNNLREETESHLDEQDKDIQNQKTVVIPQIIKDEVQNQIDNGTFDEAIDEYAGTLESRVDNLLGSLEEGSTTGDAELIDIRTSYDGEVHTSAGSAVRDIGERFRDIVGVEKIFFTNGYNVNLRDYAIGETVSLETQAVDYFSYAIVECSVGDTFLITGAKGGDNPRLYAFVDGDNKMLEKCQTANMVASDLVLVAPKQAAKLILNSTTNELEAVYQNAFNYRMDKLEESLDNYVTSEHQSFFENQNIGLGSIGLGGTVSLTPESVNGFCYTIIDCNPGDKFTITGLGGSNPRLYGFLDANNVLLEMASAGLREENLVITAPERTAKLVFNSQMRVGGSRFYHVYYGASLREAVYEVEKGLKALEQPEEWVGHTLPEDGLLATIRGTNFSNELQNNVVGTFEKPSDQMVHVSTFEILDDMVYMTYYANEVTNQEEPQYHIARLAYAPLSNTANKTYIDLQKVGDTFNEKTVTEIYDTILMKKDDTTLYLMWTASLDGEYTRLFRIFDVETKSLSEVYMNQFQCGSVINEMTISGITDALEQNGVEHKPLTIDIGIMQKISSRVENGTTYYYTGCYANAFNCIIKTKDFITWEYVAQPDFPNKSQFENAVHVFDDKVYYFLRQDWAENEGLLAYYDLTSGEWSTPVKVPDCQSRSDFFLFDGGLFLIHAPKDRSHLEIMAVNTTYLNKTVPYQTARVNDYFYPYVNTYNGELYISFTRSRRQIILCRFTLNGYTADRMLTKVNEIFYS